METTTELSISCGCVPSCARFGLCFGHCFGLCQCCHRSGVAKAPIRDARANESSRSLTPSSSLSSSSCIYLVTLFSCFSVVFGHFRISNLACKLRRIFISLRSSLFNFFLVFFTTNFCAISSSKIALIVEMLHGGGNGEVLGRFRLNRANRWLNYLFANAKFSAKLFAQLI